MNPKFSPATKKDAPTIISLMKDFYKLEKCPFSKIKAEKCFNEFVKNPALGKLVLIKLEDKIIGYTILTYGYSFEGHGKNILVDELFLKKEYRRQGIGSKALKYIIKIAKKENLETILLEVATYNEAGKKLYRKYNFKERDRIFMTHTIK